MKMYDPTFLRGELGEVEDLGKDGVGVDILGELAPGLGPASGGGVDHQGFADASELLEQVAHRVVFADLFGFSAHEVGDLQGQLFRRSFR